jgi:hypothetical protein
MIRIFGKSSYICRIGKKIKMYWGKQYVLIIGISAVQWVKVQQKREFQPK